MQIFPKILINCLLRQFQLSEQKTSKRQKKKVCNYQVKKQYITKRNKYNLNFCQGEDYEKEFGKSWFMYS